MQSDFKGQNQKRSRIKLVQRCEIARFDSHRRLRWFGHLASMPDEMLFGHILGSGVRVSSQEQRWTMSRKTYTRLVSHLHSVDEIPTQGRLEGCHRMCAATHLISGSESDAFKACNE